MLAGCLDYLRGDGMGQLCELFDGNAPHRPGGATASAASVGEILRAYVEDVLDVPPKEIVRASGSLRVARRRHSTQPDSTGGRHTLNAATRRDSVAAD